MQDILIFSGTVQDCVQVIMYLSLALVLDVAILVLVRIVF